MPAHWLAPLTTSNHLLPFRLAPTEPETVIIPRDRHGNLLSSEAARQNAFWQELDDLWIERRGIGSNTPKTLVRQLNYANKLSAQLPLGATRKRLVIYPVSGDLMRAALIPEGKSVIGHQLYRRTMQSLQEARYLVAILNAPTLQKAFQHARTSRWHFTTTPWSSVPTPAFDRDDPIHRDLADLAQQAETTVTAMQDLPASQVGASRQIRDHLTDDGTFAQIDALVKRILPEHVS